MSNKSSHAVRVDGNYDPLPEKRGKARRTIVPATQDVAQCDGHKLPAGVLNGKAIDAYRPETPGGGPGEPPPKSASLLRLEAHLANDRRFVDPLINEIREMWKRRQAWHRAEKSLTLAAMAHCRRSVGVKGKDDKEGLRSAQALFARIENDFKNKADRNDIRLSRKDRDDLQMVFPFLQARAILFEERKYVEKHLESLGYQLPQGLQDLVEEIKGLGMGSLVSLIGEAGDFTAYISDKALLKRFGVGVINGQRQRKLPKEEQYAGYGYNPARRAVLWNVGNSLIGAGSTASPRPLVGENIDERPGLTYWQRQFLKELRAMANRKPEHKRKDRINKAGELCESFSKHAAAHAKRMVEKEFIICVVNRWRSISSTASSEVTQRAST